MTEKEFKNFKIIYESICSINTILTEENHPNLLYIQPHNLKKTKTSKKKNDLEKQLKIQEQKKKKEEQEKFKEYQKNSYIQAIFLYTVSACLRENDTPFGFHFDFGCDYDLKYIMNCISFFLKVKIFQSVTPWSTNKKIFKQKLKASNLGVQIHLNLNFLKIDSLLTKEFLLNNHHRFLETKSFLELNVISYGPNIVSINPKNLVNSLNYKIDQYVLAKNKVYVVKTKKGFLFAREALKRKLKADVLFSINIYTNALLEINKLFTDAEFIERSNLKEDFKNAKYDELIDRRYWLDDLEFRETYCDMYGLQERSLYILARLNLERLLADEFTITIKTLDESREILISLLFNNFLQKVEPANMSLKVEGLSAILVDKKNEPFSEEYKKYYSNKRRHFSFKSIDYTNIVVLSQGYSLLYYIDSYKELKNYFQVFDDLEMKYERIYFIRTKMYGIMSVREAIRAELNGVLLFYIRVKSTAVMNFYKSNVWHLSPPIFKNRIPYVESQIVPKKN